MEQNALLQLSHISKRYKTQLALKDISMTLRKGEILGFLGPSGAGKTTTIRMLASIISPTSGSSANERGSKNSGNRFVQYGCVNL